MTTPQIAALESFIFDKMSSTRLPGLSIALVKGGDGVYARGADIARGRAATPDTLFGAASVTKSFVAIAILQLAEKGLLKLTDPVERYLPCPIPSKKGPIRIEHLLTHTSGMPGLGYIEAILRHAHGIGGCALPIAGPRDVLTFLHGSEEWLESEPGERWFYLNEGYVLLGEIIARITGVPYERYVTEHILRPLEMSRSSFAEEDVTREADVAVPYVLPKPAGEPRPGRYLHNVLGADAALITSASDLARYVAMLLRRGRGVMSESFYEAMTAPRIAMPATTGRYGLGVSITDDFFGEPLIGHGGSLVVSTSYIGFLPKSNVGVAVLTNGNGYAMPQLGKVALAVLLGREAKELPFVRTENLLTNLTGHYETYRGTLRTKISREDDFLRMEYVCGDQPPTPATLVPDSLDAAEPTFFTISEGQRLPVQFRVSGAGIELIYERYKFRRTGPLV